MFREGVLCTTARLQNRAEINQHFLVSGEQCWLRGNLVPAGEAFDAIDSHFGRLVTSNIITLAVMAFSVQIFAPNSSLGLTNQDLVISSG
jgi:hypothetical protein